MIDAPGGAATGDELIRRGVVVDYRRGGGIRIAPHFYNTEEEVDHAMAVLAEGGRNFRLKAEATAMGYGNELCQWRCANRVVPIGLCQ